MATTFSSLPIVDLNPLKSPSPAPADLDSLSQHLHDVFATTGFAYLVNTPLSFNHADVFSMAESFFALPDDEKMKLAKRSFRGANRNTYRGYFPTQPDLARDNLKEGFEIGPPTQISTASSTTSPSSLNLAEPNVWPENPSVFPARPNLEQLYSDLQSLASSILSLLARSLGKPPDFFATYLADSLSTLRLLHYPLVSAEPVPESESDPVRLSCTPHTDSGILTLLLQDRSGGLEVRNSDGAWVPAPYVRDSLVVNIGDLMAKVSGGRFVATMHRVRRPEGKGPSGTGGRLSVPFFFEPGENCLIRAVEGDEEVVVYGRHVRDKMRGFVEFRGLDL
ncbi:2OG-FeII oxygenase superfamily [Aspergillus sp. HF37]|nr:2OG-FeII oxygenase superfamily [Aspergillus sp. HF37]